ncbi:MAG: branched-chain amino acid ABC transporter permease, partial [Rhodopirellula sp.]|nr:branched-chain amino acid ABC transporter permease [Rhodopirellula sp.]
AHAAFYGIGAYAYTLLLTGAGLHPLLALGAAILITAIIALGTGTVALRFRGDLFLFVTLGFQMIAFVILYNWVGLTKGPYGIPGIPRPSFFGMIIRTPMQYAILALVMNAMVLPLLFALYRSPFGKALKALRENEAAASALGINPRRLHIQAFVWSAAFAAIPGAFYASYITYIDPSSFTLKESIFIAATLLLGGSGNRIGPLVGVVLMLLLPEALRFVGLPDAVAHNLREIIYGLLLAVLMYLRPQGIAGEYRMS